MPQQYRPCEFECVDHGEYIVTKAIEAASGSGETRSAKPAPREAVHVEVTREFRCELIKDVSGVSTSGKQEYGPTRTTPIEHFQSDIVLRRHELNLVRRRVLPAGSGLR